MSIYFAIFNRQSSGTRLSNEEWEGAKLEGELEEARVQKVNASSTTAASAIIAHFFGGDVSANANIVTEANFGEEVKP